MGQDHVFVVLGYWIPVEYYPCLYDHFYTVKKSNMLYFDTTWVGENQDYIYMYCLFILMFHVLLSLFRYMHQVLDPAWR